MMLTIVAQNKHHYGSALRPYVDIRWRQFYVSWVSETSAPASSTRYFMRRYLEHFGHGD